MDTLDVSDFVGIAAWIENPKYLWLIGCIFFLLTFAMLWGAKSTMTIEFRILDLVLVAATSVSLISAFSDASIRYDPIRINLLGDKYDFARRGLISRLDFMANYHCNMAGNSIKTEFSPPNFDELVAADRALCVWATQAKSKAESIPENLSGNVYSVAILEDMPSNAKATLYDEDSIWIRSLASNLDSVSAEYSEFVARRTDFFSRNSLAIFAPLFLAAIFGAAFARAVRSLFLTQ